jgi:acetoin utilization deacetylase AcuC-like enzyme
MTAPELHFVAAAIKKVAILDFDVHHGNGTQSCVANLTPNTLQCVIKTPFSSGVQMFPAWKPWQDEHDVENVFFAR